MRILVASAALTLLLAFSVRAEPAAPPPGAADYLEGLDAIEHARWADAAASLSKAVEADEENADYRVARGVALALGEKLPEAQADLTRALRLNRNHQAGKLWLASVVAMQGDFQHDTDFFPAATHDIYETAVREASRQYGAFAWSMNRAGSGREPPAANGREARERAAAVAKFPEFGAAFASRTESAMQSAGPALAGLLRDRALRRLQQKDYAGALPDLTRLLASNPADPDLLAAHAAAVLGLGPPVLPRLEATFVLTAHPADAGAYITRAIAAARMGDTVRAGADLHSAAALRPATASQDRAAAAAALAETPAPFPPAELPARLEELRKMAQDHAAWDALVVEATSIVKGENSIRRRFDEGYQDRLTELAAAAEREPNSADRLSDLGNFLYRGAIGVRGDAVEPRATFRAYRAIGPDGQAREIARAEAALDAALKIDPRHLGALTGKAAVLTHHLRWGDAETLLRQAQAIKNDDPRVLSLLTLVLDHAAEMHAASAASLREVRTWSDLRYIYTRWPSPGELQDAAEYDAQAERIWGIASDALQAAARAHPGTAESFYYTGLVARRGGDPEAARNALLQAVKLAPDNPEYHDVLAEADEEKDLPDEAAAERAAAVNLVHTTAAPLLRRAWQQIPMTQFKSARRTLHRAMEIDPADPRPLSYLGMIALADEKPDEALAWLTAAAALDEAQARLEGRSAASVELGATPAWRVGLGIALDRKAGELLMKQNRPAEAVAILRLGAATGDRVPQDHLYEPVAAAMLPDASLDPTTVPEAPSTAELLAHTRVALAQALDAAGNTVEARRECQRVVGYEANAPHVVDIGTHIRYPVAEAVLWLAKDSLKRGEVRPALDLMGRYGAPGDSPAPFVQEFQRVFDEARRAAESGNQSPPAAPWNRNGAGPGSDNSPYGGARSVR